MCWPINIEAVTPVYDEWEGEIAATGAHQTIITSFCRILYNRWIEPHRYPRTCRNRTLHQHGLMKNIRDGVYKRLLSFGRCALNRSREKNPLDSDDFLIGASTLEYNAILYSSLLCARKSSYQKNGSLSKARLDIGRGTGKSYLPVLLLLLFRKSEIVNIDSNSYNEKAGREMDHTRNRRRKGCGTAAEMQLS